jgi:ribosomal protein L18
VFCSNRQLYAVLADDHNKKILFYGSTLQKSICGDPPCGTVVSRRRHLLHLEFGLYSDGNLEIEFASPARPAQEAARKVGEELVRVCNELGISEVSYDRNGFARGDKMMAFEVPVSQHGFLPR